MVKIEKNVKTKLSVERVTAIFDVSIVGTICGKLIKGVFFPKLLILKPSILLINFIIRNKLRTHQTDKT